MAARAREISEPADPLSVNCPYLRGVGLTEAEETDAAHPLRVSIQTTRALIKVD
jgi:hypothetical protein